MNPTIRIAHVLDPRFPGGTSSAVAAELEALNGIGQGTVYALSTTMFSDRPVAPVLADALDRLRIPVVWDPGTISADVVIFHNPASLKFGGTKLPMIVARDLIVVCHENFLRPGGYEGFDVAGSLAQIDQHSLALRKRLAPISDWNRRTIEDWMQQSGSGQSWGVLPVDWFNICDFEMRPPAPHLRDRRGRHSRAGTEKFPDAATMDLCFPATAESNVILGGDHLMAGNLGRPHWTLIPFGAISVERYLGMIDVMVYYTAPTWRESFGRVLAEGIAAGKLVISDPDTARILGPAVIGADPEDVDEIIAEFIVAPERYHAHVSAAQAHLARFSANAFRTMFHSVFQSDEAVLA